MSSRGLRRSLALPALFGLLALVLSAAPLTAAPALSQRLYLPSLSSVPLRLVFMREAEHDTELYSVYADGQGLARLTAEPGYDGEPAWSPDGRQIAYTHIDFGAEYPAGSIYVMDSDGGNKRRLTDPSFYAMQPGWSPDGKSLIFSAVPDVQHSSESRIYRVNADGSGLAALTDGGRSVQARWSPDGRLIAFVKHDESGFHVYVMAGDGSGARRVIAGQGVESNPGWSPDGGQIGFVSFSSNQALLGLARPDGRDLHSVPIPPVAISSSLPALTWAPDGGRIALAASFRKAEESSTTEIVVLNSDGTGLRRLGVEGYAPAWSPDGQTIAFDTFTEIWLIGANGGGLRKVANGRWAVWEPWVRR